MKKAGSFTAALVLALSISALDCSGLTCSIVTPEVKELPWGEYLLLAALGDEGGCEEPATYTWSSSIDGFLGEGISLRINNLSGGKHTIELEVTSPCGGSCTKNMQVEVKAAKLGIVIRSPRNRATYPSDMDVPFECYASGGKAPYTYAWTLDGDVVGKESMFTKDLPPGEYSVALSVRDSSGTQKNAGVSFIVSMEKLTASIDSPLQYQTVIGESLDLGATVSGGTRPYSYRWICAGKVVSTEEGFSLKNASVCLSASYAPIVLEVTDSGGETIEAEVYARKQQACVLDGSCEASENYATCPGDCASGSQDGFCDAIPEGICDPDCGTDHDGDCVCDGDGACDIGREDNVICPLECVPGSFDGVCDQAMDGACDPDCASMRDPDCKDSRSGTYFLILLASALLVLIYALAKKRVS